MFGADAKVSPQNVRIWKANFYSSLLKVKVKVPILIVERMGPELIPDSRQSACR